MFARRIFTCERHEQVAVLRGHRLHPGLVGHDVSPGLEKTLPKQLVCQRERATGREREEGR